MIFNLKLKKNEEDLYKKKGDKKNNYHQAVIYSYIPPRD